MDYKLMKTEGFTLIEVLMYIALFAIIIGGSMTAVYQIIESTAVTNAQIMVLEEGNFLQRKIEHTLFGSSSVSATATTLTVSKAGSTYVFSLGGNDMTLDRGSGAVLLNNSFVAVTQDGVNPVFVYDGVSKVDVRFLVDGQLFSQTKYVY